MEKVGSLELWSLNSQKLCFFSQIFADVSKKSEAVIAIYVYASESSRLALLENDVDYYAMTLRLDGIIVWSWWLSLNICWVSTFFDILFPSIWWAVAQTPIRHFFLKEHDEVIHMDINKLL